MKKEFKVYSPLTRKSVHEFTKKENSESDSERILLHGVASTTSRDLHDEIVASTAIESMQEQALGLNIHGDHWYGLDDVIGAIKDATVEDEELHIKFLITKKYTPDILDLLETGVKLGLSIGGYVTSYDEKNRIINAIELHEISLTAMPANWDTFGTVTTSKGLIESNCLTGACHAIVKKLEDETMKQETLNKDSTEEENSGVSLEDVKEFINEYMAEKEETIVQEIMDTIDSKIDSVVEAKVQEMLNEDSSSESETGEETKATSTEEEDETEDKDEEETKSLSKDDVAQTVKSTMAEILGDDFAGDIANKMFNNLDKTRTNKGSKFDQFVKAKETKEVKVEEPAKNKSTYSSKDAASIIMEKQKRGNPIVNAAMKNLE